MIASSAPTKRPLSPLAVPECAACMAERCHTKAEDAKYHPLSGHGYSKETGWTDELAKALHFTDNAKPLPPYTDDELWAIGYVTENAKRKLANTTPEANHVH